MSDVKVSVIIPVYNVEKYLNKCLDSLLSQTLKEIEIICVDDGSTDSSPDILKNYGARDGRIKLLAQQNLYAGAARNNGLRIASGEYIIFLDADDFFEDTLLEDTYNKAKEKNADIVLFDADQYDTKLDEYRDVNWYFRKDKIIKTEVFSSEYYAESLLRITSPAPWTKLIRRQFFIDENIEFMTTSNTNDLFAIYLALILARRITYVDKKLVHYRVGDGSSTQSKKDKNPLCCIHAYEKLYEELKSRKLYDTFKLTFANACMSSCTFLFESFHTDQARIALVEAMESEKFAKMGICDFDAAEYEDSEKLAEFKGIYNSAQFARKLEQAYKDKNAKIVKENAVKNPLVSVIIPIYNVERYLAKCLDSIVNQDLYDIEIICVNDGSPDNSVDIAMSYAQQDSRIMVISQENAGLSGARNIGIAHAKGKYIYFMDSDDILEKNALGEISARAERDNLDIVYFDANCFEDKEGISFENSDTDEYFNKIKNYYIRSNSYEGVYTGPDMMAAFLENEEYRVSACIQFLRRDFVVDNEKYFIRGILHEDNAFTYETILSAERVGYINKPYFNRRVRAASITSQKTKFDHSYGYFKSYVEMQKFYYSIAENLRDNADAAAIEVLKRCLDNARHKCREISMEDRMSYMLLPQFERINYRQHVAAETNRYEHLMGRYDKMKLQRDEKNKKLKETYAEKSDLTRKLKLSYEEKSELNKKLKQTYKEKADRGKEIERLKGQLKDVTIKYDRARHCFTFVIVVFERKCRSLIRIILGRR